MAMSDADRLREYNHAYYLAHRKNNLEDCAKRTAASRAHYLRHKDDPDFKEKQRQRKAKCRQEHKDDPAYKQKLRVQSAAKWQRHKDDPAWREEQRAKARATYKRLSSDPEYVAKRRVRKNTAYRLNLNGTRTKQAAYYLRRKAANQ